MPEGPIRAVSCSNTRQTRKVRWIQAKRPNITAQIIANSQGATCAFGRAFEILISKSEPLIYVEDIGSARYIRKTDEASQYLLTFDHLRASALDEERTINLIKDAINDQTI
jgi:Domain of unknown function (DUF5753)